MTVNASLTKHSLESYKITSICDAYSNFKKQLISLYFCFHDIHTTVKIQQTILHHIQEVKSTKCIHLLSENKWILTTVIIDGQEGIFQVSFENLLDFIRCKITHVGHVEVQRWIKSDKEAEPQLITNSKVCVAFVKTNVRPACAWPRPLLMHMQISHVM